LKRLRSHCLAEAIAKWLAMDDEPGETNPCAVGKRYLVCFTSGSWAGMAGPHSHSQNRKGMDNMLHIQALLW
jgi:hypothetical protein